MKKRRWRLYRTSQRVLKTRATDGTSPFGKAKGVQLAFDCVA